MNNENNLELLQAAVKAFRFVLPKLDPLKQEKLFVAVSLAKEQTEYAIHLLDLAKGDMPNRITSFNKVDGKLKDLEENMHRDIEGYVTVSTIACKLYSNCYKPNDHRPPCARWGGEVIDGKMRASEGRNENSSG